LELGAWSFYSGGSPALAATLRRMRLLDRYLLREILIPLGYCLGGFLLFWVAFNLISDLGDLQAHKMHGDDILKYYLLKTPEFLVFVLPIGLLLALLYALTHHARHHEITAIRAAGVSLWRLCLPYFAVGLVGTVLLFVLNEYCVPQLSERAEQIKNRRTGEPQRLVQPFAFINARDGRTWGMRTYNPETGEMTAPQVYFTAPDGSHHLIAADRALRVDGIWTFYNARELHETADNPALVPLLQTNQLAMPAFTETLEEIQSEINVSRGMSSHGKFKADVPLSQILDYLRLHPRPPTSETRFWLYTKLHGRLAAPWTCLIVVLIAIPFGAASGRRNVFVGVAGSILICFIYFVLQQAGLALGTSGRVPSWLAAWFPNLIFGFTGILMTASVR
jgi:lipopolysaccharide export system permease protein